jgi:hypothetical protein
MVVIKNASFGDEKSSVDVTKSVLSKESGGKIEVVANSSLVSMFDTAIELNDADEEDIRAKAETECGNANDTGCMNATMNKLRQTRLEEKKTEVNTNLGVLKGKRLTVEVEDDDGKTRQIITPAEQVFTLEGLKQGESKFKVPEVTVSGTITTVVTWLGTSLALFIYVFSIVSTYRTFIDKGYSIYIAYAALAAAVLIPYSGLVLMLVVSLGKEVILNAFAKKQVAPTT